MSTNKEYLQAEREKEWRAELRKGRWTEEDLQRQEENIRYDLSEDGFIVQINRLKGLGLMRSEEALWELCIASV